MEKIVTFIFVSCLMFFPAHLRGEDVFLSGPLFHYIEDKIHYSRLGATESEVRAVLDAYSSVETFLKDIVLGLQTENHRINEEVFVFLMRIHEHKTKIQDYETIKKFMLMPEVGREIRRLNGIDHTKKERSLIFDHKVPMMNIIGYYELRPLFDIIYVNTSHEEPWIRSTAYFTIGEIGKFEKRKALLYLRRGLKDSGTYMVGPSFSRSVSEDAVESCVRLGCRFRLLLWIHAPEYRFKLYE